MNEKIKNSINISLDGEDLQDIIYTYYKNILNVEIDYIEIQITRLSDELLLDKCTNDYNVILEISKNKK